MKKFIVSALPLIMAGIALAVLAVNYRQEKLKGEKRKWHIAVGAGLGLLLGVALNSCGLWHNHLLGLVFGPLWGMALGSLYQGKKAQENASGCDKEEN